MEPPSVCSRVYPGYLPVRQEGWPWLTPPTYMACLTAWPFPFPAPWASCTNDDGYKTTEAIEDRGQHGQPASFLRYFLRAQLSTVASPPLLHSTHYQFSFLSLKKKKCSILFLGLFSETIQASSISPLPTSHLKQSRLWDAGKETARA